MGAGPLFLAKIENLLYGDMTLAQGPCSGVEVLEEAGSAGELPERRGEVKEIGSSHLSFAIKGMGIVDLSRKYR